jgi:hypothetical protein
MREAITAEEVHAKYMAWGRGSLFDGTIKCYACNIRKPESEFRSFSSRCNECLPSPEEMEAARLSSMKKRSARSVLELQNTGWEGRCAYCDREPNENNLLQWDHFKPASWIKYVIREQFDSCFWCHKERNDLREKFGIIRPTHHCRSCSDIFRKIESLERRTALVTACSSCNHKK